MRGPPPTSPLFPAPPLSRPPPAVPVQIVAVQQATLNQTVTADAILFPLQRSEEHTSELQSQSNLVCRLLLEKKTTSLRNFSPRHICISSYTVQTIEITQ